MPGTKPVGRPTPGGRGDGSRRTTGSRAPRTGDATASCPQAFDAVGFVYVLLEVVPPSGHAAADLVVSDLNETAASLLGRDRDSVVGRPFLDLRPYASEEVAGRLRSVARSGTMETFEVEPPGTGRTFRVRLFRPQNGFVAGIARDVTVEMQPVKELEERLAELRETQRIAKVGTWSRVLAEGTSTWSDETYRIHGLAPGDPVPSWEVIPRFYSPETFEKLWSAFERARRDGMPYEVEVHLTRADGSRATAIARGEGIRDATGRVVRLRGTVTDISELAEARAELEALRSQLAHVSRVSVLGEMVSSLAHDLSQPLAAILANAQAAARVLRQGNPPPTDFPDLLGDIVAEAGRAAAVIGQLRAHLRRESPSPEPLDVAAVVEDAVRLVAAEARTHGIEIVRRLAPGLPPVLGNRIQLQQVLVNLILNAIDAMKEGTRHRTVTIRTFREGRRVVVETSDAGPGIPERLLEKVFEPFYSTKLEGLGIGLPSCRTIVQAHGGAIRALRRRNCGATIVISLPAAPAATRSQEAS